MVSNPLPPGLYLDSTAVVTASSPPADTTVSPVAQTSANSFELMDAQATQIDPAKDKHGPFTLIASVEKSAASATATPGPTPTPAAAPASQPTRLVVFGDTAFATDRVLQLDPSIAEGNSEAAIAAVQWLSAAPGGIIIPTKAPEDRSLVLTAAQSNLLIFGNALFVPALVLLGGIAVWLRRR
jgi:ABC-type uncharacterized transport system involved in gliding motility auxiliary subunit